LGKGKKEREGPAEKGKRILEELERKEQKQARLFRIDDVLADASKIHEEYIPELGYKIQYGLITLGDLEEIDRQKTLRDKTYCILAKMLQKADPNVTVEKIKKLPFEHATLIINRLIPHFLPQIQKLSKLGSDEAQ